jgi:thymidylate synthase (FAD)|tara:strand:- start:10536 stop:11219 length:684 start_codon:yes stop_codon:yes gene_type:complete
MTDSTSSMQVNLIDHMGSDLTVVNAARVSMNKESDWNYWRDEDDEYQIKKYLKPKDEKLIKYLAKHDHWTPFGHPQVTFRIKAPIFVARQLGKHQVGMVWNEVSRRYVDNEPEFYEPEVWRGKADNIKQGSSDEVIEYSIYPAHIFAKQCYENMLSKGIAPEMARMVLPQSMYTEWYWTGSLAAWARVCKLRIDSNTQKETQEIVLMFTSFMEQLYPISWKELMNDG